MIINISKLSKTVYSLINQFAIQDVGSVLPNCKQRNNHQFRIHLISLCYYEQLSRRTEKCWKILKTELRIKYCRINLIILNSIKNYTRVETQHKIDIIFCFEAAFYPLGRQHLNPFENSNTITWTVSTNIVLVCSFLLKVGIKSLNVVK